MDSWLSFAFKELMHPLKNADFLEFCTTLECVGRSCPLSSKTDTSNPTGTPAGPQQTPELRDLMQVIVSRATREASQTFSSTSIQKTDTETMVRIESYVGRALKVRHATLWDQGTIVQKCVGGALYKSFSEEECQAELQEALEQERRALVVCLVDRAIRAFQQKSWRT